MLFIQTAEDTLFHKPDPKVFNHCLRLAKLIGLNKKDIIYIGDSSKDKIAANKAGIDFLLAKKGILKYE